MQGFQRYLYLSFKFRFTVARFLCLASGCDEERRPVAKFIVFCSTCTIASLKRFTFAISSADELLVYNCLYCI